MNTGQTCQFHEDNVRAWPGISFSWTVTTTDIVNFHQPFQPGHEITISGSLGTTLCPLHLGTWADCRRAGLSFSLTPLPHPPLARTTFTVVIGSNQYGLVLSPVDFQSCGSLSGPRCGSDCQGTWRSPLQDCEMEHLPIPIPVRISSLRNKMTFLTMLRYQGQTFYGCTKHRSTNGAAWCKTTEGLYEDCQADCQPQNQAQCRWSIFILGDPDFVRKPGRQCWIQCLPGTTEEIPTKLETSGWKIATPALASRSDFSEGGDNAEDWEHLILSPSNAPSSSSP